MAKSSAAKKQHRNDEASEETQERPKALRPVTTAPAGYQKQTTELVGFWDPETSGPLHAIPLYIIVADSNIEPEKPSTLVFMQVVDKVTVLAPGEDGEVLDAKPGELVGVWAKPGMIALKNLAGQKVYMAYIGEKDTGKPNPMKLFDIFSPGKGNVLKIETDRREKSKGRKAVLEDIAAKTVSRPDVPAGDAPAGEEIPF